MSTLIRKLYHVKRAAGLMILLAAVALLTGCPEASEEPAPPVEPPPAEPVGPPVAEADLPPVVARLSEVQLQPLFEAHEGLTLEKLEGQVTLVNFWGPWCMYCKPELPYLANFSEKYAYNPNFRIVTVAYPGSYMSTKAEKPKLTDDVKSTLDLQKIDGLPVFYDEDNVTKSAFENVVAFEGYPTTFIMDKTGGIRKVWVGFVDGYAVQMEEMINLLLRHQPEEASAE